MTATNTASLQDRFHGRVIVPGDEGYDEARTVFNSMIDKRPAVIVRCADVDDVVSAVTYGRENDLEIAIRSGGHGVAGTGSVDGGLVIDMRVLDQVSVDPVAKTATVGGGATWGTFDKAVGQYGLATTGGRVSTTGVSGLTLGGGSGWLERKFGLACDNLLSVELVTADGSVVTANDNENQDLFWALHGGGGNFGVATSLTFRLYEVATTTLMLLFFHPDRGPEVIRRYRDFMAAAPDEVGGGVIYLTGPEEEFVPEHLQGRLTMAIAVTYVGDQQEAQRTVAPLLNLGHEGALIAEMPYPEMNSSLDDPPGYRNYWSVEYLEELPDGAIDAFCATAYDMIVPSPSQHALFAWGGGVARGTRSALADRHVKWGVHPLGLWENPADDARGIAWARNVCAAVRPYATGAVYLNFMGDEGQERVIAGFGRENYDLLVAVKTAWDPDNVFHLNQNIKPAAPVA